MDEPSPPEEFDLPPPTAPTNFTVALQGFSNREDADRFGNTIAMTVQSISCIMNLERLDGITVAFDYDNALIQLDRGFNATIPLTRTNDGRLVGVGMAATVLRGGTVKAHLVLHAPYVMPLEEQGTPAFRQALYLVAHECGHIADLKTRDEAFPGVILQRSYVDFEEQLLAPTANALWDEYAACRASAPLGRDHTSLYEQGLTAVLPDARNRVNAAIRSYRRHRDISQLLQEAGEPLCQPLRVAAYLVGHLDGLEDDFDLVPAARDMLAASPYLSFVNRLRGIARQMWERRGHWNSLAEFEPLQAICRDLYADGGMLIQKMPDGTTYVKVPFTLKTIPWPGCFSKIREIS